MLFISSNSTKEFVLIKRLITVVELFKAPTTSNGW